MRFIFLIILWLPTISTAQSKHDYTWMFGPWKGYGTMLLFGESMNIVNNVEYAFDISKGATMISDKYGNLQYYSSGCRIADSDHEIVLGADTLNPGWYYENWCFDGFPYPYGDQSMVFLPFEDDIYKLIYKYSNRKIIGPNMVDDIVDTIYMASITNGDLDYVNKAIFNDTLSFGNLAAVKHYNNIDYWIVTPHDSSDIYFSMHISKDSVLEVIEQQFKEVIRRNNRGTKSKFSPDGSIYLDFEGNYMEQSLKFFSFNRSSGLLDFLFDMSHVEGDPSLVGGIEFSPSGRYLYVSTRNFIYQYDLEASDIEGSKTVVAEYDGFADPFPCTFHVMQLGPDCRIYVNTSNSQQWLHVIMYPDRPGIECEVRQHHIPLYYYHQISMPYFPNYRLGTGEPVCDSTLSLPTSIPIVYVPEGGIRVWPNPARGQVWLGLSESLVHEAAVLTLYDMMGRQVWQQDYTGGDTISIDLYSLSPGIYVLQVQGRDGRRWTEKLIVE